LQLWCSSVAALLQLSTELRQSAAEAQLVLVVLRMLVQCSTSEAAKKRDGFPMLGQNARKLIVNKMRTSLW